MYYIGLDIGTSGTKASLIDRHGDVVRTTQVSYGFSDTAEGKRELDAAVVWEAITTCLSGAGAAEPVKTITVSALGEAIIPVSQEGLPLAGSITGTDARGAKELEKLKEQVGAHRLTEITGQNLSAIYSAAKIMWLNTHCPGLLSRTWKILTFQDYAVYRLCGHAAMDASMASRTLLFDADTGGWSKELLEAAQIPEELLADILPAGSVAGELMPSVARRLGLGPGIRIVVGTHDHICNAIGSGVCEAGSCANTVGTTEGLTAVIQKSWLSTDHIERFQISREPFAAPGLYNTVAWNNTSGVLLKWFVQKVLKKDKPEELLPEFEALNQAMGEQPTGLLVLPHFSGAATPYMDDQSKGAILGLTLDTGREEIYRALMEGANFELALILDAMKQAGLTPKKLVATGGALSPQLLQIKADILGMEIRTVKNRQTGTLGGAILGAVAAGDYADIQEAVGAMVQEDLRYEPDPSRSEYYRARFTLYRRLYPAVSGISAGLNGSFSDGEYRDNNG